MCDNILAMLLDGTAQQGTQMLYDWLRTRGFRPNEDGYKLTILISTKYILIRETLRGDQLHRKIIRIVANNGTAKEFNPDELTGKERRAIQTEIESKSTQWTKTDIRDYLRV